MSPALRTFASVISGYFLMGGIVIVVDLGVGLAFADAFEMAAAAPGQAAEVPQFSGGATVLLAMLAGSVLAAIAGGALSGKVGGGAKGPRILAALVLVLGLMSNVTGALAYPETVPAWSRPGRLHPARKREVEGTRGRAVLWRTG